MSYKIPLYVPYLGKEEKKYVNEALDSGWISSKGKFIKKFEEEFAKKVNRNYAICVCNGTVALHLALESLELKKNTAVICPSLTYVSSINAIRFAGLIPIFIDCGETGVSNIEDYNKGIKIAEENNIEVSALMIVHLYGVQSNIDEIKKLKYPIIEDCAESFGSLLNNKISGSNDTEAACFSFFGNKTITTGEGGMVVCNDKNIYDKCYILRGVGQKPLSPQRYLHIDVGYNYRMTNLSAAIGCAQLEKADIILEKKRHIANTYKNYFKSLGLYKDLFLPEPENFIGNNWLITILTKTNIQREGLMLFLEHYHIETRPAFLPIHSMIHLGKSFRVKDMSNTERIGMLGVNLPSYPDLIDNDIVYICDKINEYLKNY